MSAQRWTRPLAAVSVLLLALGLLAVVTADRWRDRQLPLTLDGQRDWQLALLNRDIAPSVDEVRARFAPSFLEAVPPGQILTTVQPLQELAPWRVTKQIERRGRVLAVQLRGKGGVQVRLTLQLARDGRAESSTILLAQPCGPAVEAKTRLSAALAAQSAWFLEYVDSNLFPDDAELRAHLTPEFLDDVPADTFRVELSHLRPLLPLRLRHYEGRPTDVSFVARMGVVSGEEARYTLTIEPGPPHRITGLRLTTQPPCRT